MPDPEGESLTPAGGTAIAERPVDGTGGEAVVGRAGGMNVVQNQVLVLAQGEHQWAARLLQGNGHAAGWETPPQLGYPLLNGLRSVEHLAPLDLAAGAVRGVDRESAQVITIPLARISAVIPVPPSNGASS